MIAVLTLNDITNYGNKLQNYALTRVLSLFGFATTVRSVTTAEGSLSVAQRAERGRLFKAAIKSLFPSRRAGFRRAVSFVRFRDGFIPDCKIVQEAGRGIVMGTFSDPDVVVIGSDQVWNYSFGFADDDLAMYLGKFFSSEKLLTYAASFGIDSVDSHHAEILREYLMRIKHISVREFRAAEIVAGLTGQHAEVVLDPTLLLPPAEWRKLESGFVPDGERYVLTYFLGEPSPAQEAIIQEEARRRGARVRRILDHRDRETLSAGPREFVELFDRAECVFADSFHACCFSILFHKPFKVFNRADMGGSLSMNSRMETLFRLFELETDMSDGPLPEIRWNRVDELLEAHRARSLSWLEDALGASQEASRG